ncbi:hypothetical protein P7E02_23025 [Enterococcus hulanensis]|uniref:hypothetical protein n=1 Tax=Enterococcus hulanensis TaxID=2559929 RepID=UPI00288CB7BC|nr:hypothetical protein [Enterococcus hulanensis]MDT2662777.1 hypothetical protein [Enterococcus hulanensis]
MKQSKIKEFFLSFKNSNKIYRYLFSLACLTCISIGWTSAKYTSEIYASSDSARSAKFSYNIENEVKNSGVSAGNLIDYESTRHVNKYDIKTSDEKIEVIFYITLKSEVAVNLTMRKDTSETILPLNVDSVTLKGDSIEDIIVDQIEEYPKINDVISLDIEPFDGEREYECTVLLSHNGYDGKIDNYINLVPIINQID